LRPGSSWRRPSWLQLWGGVPREIPIRSIRFPSAKGELGAAKTMPKLFVGQRLTQWLQSGSIRVRHLIATNWWWLALAITPGRLLNQIGVCASNPWRLKLSFSRCKFGLKQASAVIAVSANLSQCQSGDLHILIIRLAQKGP